MSHCLCEGHDLPIHRGLGDTLPDFDDNRPCVVLVFRGSLFRGLGRRWPVWRFDRETDGAWTAQPLCRRFSYWRAIGLRNHLNLQLADILTERSEGVL